MLKMSISPASSCPPRVENDLLQESYRRDLASFARMLHDRHYVSGCDGNLSVRLDKNSILTTPTGMSKGLLKPEHMVLVDLQGRKLEGAFQPSSEIERIGCSGTGLTEPVCSELVLTLGEIPLAPYAPPGTSALSDSLLPFIAGHDAILMQNHGVVAYGATLSQAYLNMETVEHTARITLVSRLLGSMKPLNADQVCHLLDMKAKKTFPRSDSQH